MSDSSFGDVVLTRLEELQVRLLEAQVQLAELQVIQAKGEEPPEMTKLRTDRNRLRETLQWAASMLVRYRKGAPVLPGEAKIIINRAAYLVSASEDLDLHLAGLDPSECC